MPQIYIIPSQEFLSRFVHDGVVESQLGPALVRAVEEAFGIQGTNDTAVTCVAPPKFTIDEADLQIEVRYTAGKDEYGRGRPFDPTEEEQVAASELIRQALGDFFSDQLTWTNTSASVWFKPYYHSFFKMWKKGILD